ncbi:putative E3 ubiquitin-protein ligase LIN-1 [Vicia villosa]|uniref:putative E3 ubiquitin-protein ligase LIN-1 n=1 Tax=Vicia villosa TaxID=3911 RepID=UPI00273A94BE|nr:putative E3 ubiquitin-protein ligase LIN-1 [Vicia villosa]
MASSLQELLAKEGFKGSSKKVLKSRSSFHHGASSDPLHSLEDRLCVSSSERIKTQKTKSKTASRYQTSNTNDSKNTRPRVNNNNVFVQNKISHERLKNESHDSSESDSGFEDVYSNRVSNAKRGKDKKEKIVEKPMKDSYMLRQSSGNRKSYENNNQVTNSQDPSNLAIDEIAVKALVSILNGYIESFLKDEDFRSALRHNCFSSLNFIHLEKEENNSETKVITSLEQAIDCVEKTAEKDESISPIHLKRATMQLSIITGLSLNDLKYDFTCGIPNFKLSACAHLYLSVVYLMQRKKKVSAKHLLQVFCDSSFQARTILLPELWEHLFSPNLSHLKKWYNSKESEIVADTQAKARKLKILQKVYNENLDSGTRVFALYYKDWLGEGVETPTIPSIGIPSLSVTSRQASSFGHSFESGSSNEPFSPQAMVSKKLYDSFFGGYRKPEVYEVEEDDKDEDSFENCERGSYGSTVVKKTLIYESETVKFIDQSSEDFTASVQTHEFRKVQPNTISSNLEGSYFPSIPPEFICPLTRKIFEEPVTLESGQTFERKAIKAWFQKGNRTCPVTGNTLECVFMPFTNLILKRLIDNWKTEDFDRLLDFASQTVENLKEFQMKKRDEAIVFKLRSLFTSLKEEEKSTYAKHIISLGVFSSLFKRFELGNVEEKSHVLEILLNCIQADSSCVYKIARSVDRKMLLELLHSKMVTPSTNAIVFLTELLSMKRRKDVTFFLSGLVGEDVYSTMHTVLMHLKSCSPIEKPLVAVLLLHFDLLVEPQKLGVYIETAVNTVAEALDASLNDEKVQNKCCKALLILCGHFSSNGKIMTDTTVLKQAGYKNGSSELKSPSYDEEDQQLDVTISSEDEEEERNEEFMINLLESFIGDGESPFLKTISRCLESRHIDLVRTCLISVTWLSSSLSKQYNAGLHLPAFLAVISQLKGILQNGKLDLKTLASMSLFNFSKISECRTLLKIMAQDIAPILHGLVDVIWTAKKLHAILM